MLACFRSRSSFASTLDNSKMRPCSLLRRAPINAIRMSFNSFICSSDPSLATCKVGFLRRPRLVARCSKHPLGVTVSVLAHEFPLFLPFYRPKRGVPIAPLIESFEGTIMAKPVVIVVGTDKGGVGKTTVSRTLLDYFDGNNIPTRAFDTESPRGTLKRFHPDVTEIVDMTTTA